MERTYPAFSVTEAIPLKDEDYYWFVLDEIHRAKRRIWMSIFIMDVTRESDPEQRVRSLIRALRDASWRGVKVRVMTGDVYDIFSIRESNKIARQFLRTRRIVARRHPSPGRSGTHDKYILFDDDLVVLGSHNWTDRAFRQNLEDSIAVKSRDVASAIEKEFLSNWNYRPPVEPDPCAEQ